MSLLLLPEIHLDVSENFDREKRLIVELVIEKLHHATFPNPNITTETMTEIIDIYWKECHDFDAKKGLFANRSNFLIQLMQLNANLTFDMSFILILTKKSMVLLHVGQLPSVLALDLLQDCGLQGWQEIKPW